MIGSLRGKILSYRSDPPEVLLEVADIGYRVNLTPSTLTEVVSATPPSENSTFPNTPDSDNTASNTPATTEPAKPPSQKPASGKLFLHIEHVVREDSQTLYGFTTTEERLCFATLLGVSGIGPQVALSVLATHTPDALLELLRDEDADSLCLVPGIGAKKAKQLLPTLKDRFAVVDITTSPDAGSVQSPRSEVRQALEGLGYSTDEIHQALSDLEHSDSSEEMLRDALSALGKN